MKINASILFGAFKYWLQNGKTNTSLIMGLVLALAQMNGITLSDVNIDMLLQFITAFSPFFAMLAAGVLDKVRKTLKLVAAERE